VQSLLAVTGNRTKPLLFRTCKTHGAKVRQLYNVNALYVLERVEYESRFAADHLMISSCCFYCFENDFVTELCQREEHYSALCLFKIHKI